MKHALLLLTLLASTAHAEIVAYTPSKSGGMVEFSDVRCAGRGLQAYAVNAHAEVTDVGCWFRQEPSITVVWSISGHTKIYNPAAIYPAHEGKSVL
jgi:hypothetical protein